MLYEIYKFIVCIVIERLNNPEELSCIQDFTGSPPERVVCSLGLRGNFISTF